MFLSDMAIRRPVFTAMLALAMLVFGWLGFRGLAVDQFPPVDFPILLVQTVYPGAAPEDVERDITKPIEDAVASTPGIDQLQSFTRDSVSLVMVRFDMGTDLADAAATVRDRVGGVQGTLPSGAELPVIRPIDLGALPVMVVALSSPGGVNDARRLADDRLRPYLEQVDGVGTVNVLGGEDREIHVDLDLDALRALSVSPADVMQRIGVENLSLPVGNFDRHGFSIGIRAEGQYKSVDDVGATVVSMTPDGRQVRLGEVASIDDGYAEPDRDVRYNGVDAVAIEVIKRSGANTVEVVDHVGEVLAEVVPTLGSGVSHQVIWNSADDIEANAEDVGMAIGFGGVMAVIVVLVFLLDLRGTFISSLALPTSVVGTFAVMAFLGYSINTMTLLGLSLAIGLLIDDAVVVREAITHRLEQGDDPMTAASRGTKEIALAVLATTLSLVAVFVPVAFMSGIVGQFFEQFGLTISAAVLLSLFVAFTLDPMLSSRLSRARDPDEQRGRVATWIAARLAAMDHAYAGLLQLVLRWRKATVGIAVASLVASVGLAALVPAEFVPVEDRGDFFADLELPVGTSLDVTSEAARGVEKQVLAIPGVNAVYTVVGYEDKDQVARLRVKLVDKREREPIARYQDKVRALIAAVPSANAQVSVPGMIEGLGDWPPIMVLLQGEDLDALTREADRVKALVASIPGTIDVKTSTGPGRPELRLEIDRTVAADRGVPAGLVALTARQLVEGNVVGTLRDQGEEADIRVRAADRFRNDAAAIAALPLPSPRGYVTLGEVARVAMGAGPSQIERTDRMRSVTVSSQVGEGGSLGAVVSELEAKMAAAPMPEGYLWRIEGQAKDMKETAAAMGLAISVALAFIFMVLASQFESLLHPFTLLVSIPLSFVGAFLALFVTGSSISMGSQIGLILLMGLVTKNAILLVDGALQNMRNHGVDPVQAMLLAGPRRLRPIVMTSTAMVFGMLPTALGTGIGSSFRAPMAYAVIGGVVSSTALTLLVVPVVFVWVEGVGGWIRARTARWFPAPVRAQLPGDETSEATQAEDRGSRHGRSDDGASRAAK
ncbi:MAG: efflux RND transporter permease subunit [Myxococcota bacterium]